MAAATLKCISGCTCDESIIEGHLPKTKNTQLYLHVVYVSQAEECVLSITVPYVRSDHYKVCLLGRSAMLAYDLLGVTLPCMLMHVTFWPCPAMHTYACDLSSLAMPCMLMHVTRSALPCTMHSLALP
eukprot:366012-Chlamydomonas_euryale.AAC.14